jgi:hypothetical protein
MRCCLDRLPVYSGPPCSYDVHHLISPNCADPTAQLLNSTASACATRASRNCEMGNHANGKVKQAPRTTAPASGLRRWIIRLGVMAVLLLAFTFLDGIKVSVPSRHLIYYQLSLVFSNDGISSTLLSFTP